MPSWDAARQRHTTLERNFYRLILLCLVLLFANAVILTNSERLLQFYKNPKAIPEKLGFKFDGSSQDLGEDRWRDNGSRGWTFEVDEHPIRGLMEGAEKVWEGYDLERSATFRQTVKKYREAYGRHPPPGFREWYQFARKRRVHNIDDFAQINDDLRPFWGMEPKVLRNLAAHATDEGDTVAGIHIRKGKVWKLTKQDPWRAETFVKMLSGFVEALPDMDLAVNRLDQPRAVVPWDDMQELLAKEVKSRDLSVNVKDEFTSAGTDLYGSKAPAQEREDWGWFNARDKNFMELAKTACAPHSFARQVYPSSEDADRKYKTELGGLVNNYNLSSDLCTVGPTLHDKHGFLFDSLTTIATKKLVPIFGECKVNVNSDILFPANMYWKHDKRYEYNSKDDHDWAEKQDVVFWRGVTSGGIQRENNWRRMHRQRLVLMLNSTSLNNTSILATNKDSSDGYEARSFNPTFFAHEHADAGFVETTACSPNCDFYNDTVVMLNKTTLSDQWDYKYLVDVDGHSFSGRFRAFLQSQSLPIKATIFREWSDSRLVAWKHFVPMDNRYDDLYTILTYFMGTEDAEKRKHPKHIQGREEVYVPNHEVEAEKIAYQGRDWARRVLRREDIEIYLYRLLLEYARIIDDNRDRIGYGGDGSELDGFDREFPPEEW